MSRGAHPGRWQVPRLDRRDRWLGGVAAAIAREIGVQPLVIRAGFVLLAAVGGWGLVLYGLIWAGLAVLSPSRISPYRPCPKGATTVHRHLAVAMIVIGLAIAFTPFTSSVFTDVVVPVGFLLTGVLIAWSRGQRDEGGLSSVVRVIAGLVVAIGGVLAIAALQFDIVNTIIAFVFGIAVLAGIALIATPSLVRMARDLDDERQQRVRADERARISAHLHDSVLQTLGLIQKEQDPAAMTRLARRQERELRNWLYGPTPSTPAGLRLGPALEAAAAEVEDTHGVRIDVVAVGDSADFTRDDLGPLIAAAREAMVNAARHSGASRIDVYVERTDSGIDVFVRDTGSGFDPTSVDAARRGLADSIVARMERAGGRAAVHSAPGVGTEVELSLPLPATSVRLDGVAR